MDLSGIDLRRDDWLMVEIALKLVKLEQASPDRRRRHRRVPSVEESAIAPAPTRS